MKPDLRPWGAALLDVLFPPACVACRTLGREPFCEVCASAVEPAPVEVPCHARAGQPGALDAVTSVYAYGGPVADAIQRLKYRGAVEVARPLGLALRGGVQSLGYDLVVPVPMTDRKLRSRGYNQARELARSIPGAVWPDALRRRHDGPAQVGQSERARREALRGAFVGVRAQLAGRRVLLVDDVVTTGATAEAVAVALKDAGARWVGLATVASTPRQSALGLP